MANIFEIKRGDLAPILRARCMDGSDGSAVDLSSATSIKLKIKDDNNILIVDAVMTKEDQTQAATKGYVRYSWVTGDTDSSGVFRGEVEVTWSDGKPQTYPRDSYFTVIVYDDLR